MKWAFILCLSGQLFSLSQAQDPPPMVEYRLQGDVKDVSGRNLHGALHGDPRFERVEGRVGLVLDDAGYGAAQPAARATVSLDGTWEFRMDPKDEGLAGKWFDAGVAYPDKIQVPGNWQAQGFGEPKGHLRHDYQGRAWYRRSVTVPQEWAGKRIWIHLGGVTAKGDVFVNGRQVGAVEHFITPHEFDITDAVTIGADNVISVQVDSDVGSHNPHKDPVVTPGPVGMFNYFGHWGGLYRPVWLEARSDVHVDTLFVTPDIGKGIARTKVVLKRSAPGNAWEGDVTVVVAPAKGGAESTAQGKVRFSEGQLMSDPALIDVAIQDPRLWSPEDPFLYHLEVVI